MHSKITMASGTILILLGVTFHFQGSGYVGPESSFMYQNAEWIGYGLTIAILGASVFVAGIVLLRR